MSTQLTRPSDIGDSLVRIAFFFRRVFRRGFSEQVELTKVVPPPLIG